MYPNEVLKIKREENLDFIFCRDLLDVMAESKGSGEALQ